MGKIKYHNYDKIGPNNILLCYRYSKDGKARGIFQCPYCGRTFDATIYKVSIGNTTRCPLCTKERRTKLGKSHGYDLSGQQFGELKVIKRAFSKKKEHKTLVFWECECSCKSIIYVETNHLTSGHTKSCGHIKSFGEKSLSQILDSMNVEYEREKTFKDLVSPYSYRLLRFDFYLPNYHCCIECNGNQHQLDYEPRGFMTADKLERLHYCDQTKKNYCTNNNIRLYIIPYQDYSKITKEYVLHLLGEIG